MKKYYKIFLFLIIAVVLVYVTTLFKNGSALATNYLLNGNFSNQLTSWGCTGDPVGSGTCNSDSTQFFSDPYSAHVINTSTRENYGWQISQQVGSADSSTTFCLSAKFKKNSPTDTARVFLSAVGSTEYGGQWGGDQWCVNTASPNTAICSESVDHNTDWQTFKKTVSVPTGWTSLQVAARVVNPGGSAWFDDISLQKKPCQTDSLGTIIDSTVGPAKTCSVVLSSSSTTYPSSVTAKVIGNNNSLTTNPAPTPPGDDVGLWVVRSDGLAISPAPTPLLWSGTYSGITYYQIAKCNSTISSCSTQATLSLPVGDYYFLCDQQRLPKCSGNPFCPGSEISRTGVDCTSWAQCSLGDPYGPFGDDAVHFVVNYTHCDRCSTRDANQRVVFDSEDTTCTSPIPSTNPVTRTCDCGCPTTGLNTTWDTNCISSCTSNPTSTPTPTPTQAPTNNCSTLGALNPIRLDPSVTSLLSLSNNSIAGLFSTSRFCLIDPRAKIPSFSLPTYADLKSIYFDQNKSTTVYKSSSVTVGNKSDDYLHAELFNCSSASKKNCLIYIQGNLEIKTSNYNEIKNSGLIAVVFVDNNLLLNDINNQKFDVGDNTSGIVFVVGGNINIDPTMGGLNKSINAFFITSGRFCSSWNGTDCVSTSTGTGDPLLTINGSVISLNPTMQPLFVRVNRSDMDPSEQIVYDPKYLVILNDIFAKDLPIWSEVQ